MVELWFGVIVFLWAGYFVLEGFDFGVGILAYVRRKPSLLETIGPHWDGNEVWLVCAVGAMFAAFPGWYADFMAQNYLALLAILVALIVRGVALEYRGKRSDAVWRRRCDVGILVGSLVPPLLWGVVLSGSVFGAPVLLGLCLLQGWAYLRLRGAARFSWWVFLGTSALMVLAAVTTVMLRYDLADLRGLAASDYGLQVISWASLAILPAVLAYQGWSYWVLRKRLVS